MTDADANAVKTGSNAYAWFVVIILAFAYAFSYLDRLIITLMVEPIKQDLGISDTQISLLIGISFAIFYTTCALPFAWMADRFNRRNIIISGISIWCIMTATCGLAKNFVTLFIARMGVGLGEAALVPAANSMIADYFKKDQIGRALAVFATGIAIGAGLSMLVGGKLLSWIGPNNVYNLPLVGALKGWQFTFVVLGLAGLCLSFVMLLVREPKRQFDEGEGAATLKSGPSLSETLAYFRKHAKVYAPLYIGYAFAQTCFYGIGGWIPTLFIRTLEWDVGTFGTVYGLLIAICGSVAVLGGGWICDKLFSRGIHDAHWWVTVMALSIIIVYCLLPFTNDGVVIFVILGVGLFASFIAAAAAPAAIILTTPNQYRAIATALFFFTINIIGMTLGPFIIAIFMEYVFKSPDSIGASIGLLAGIAWVMTLIVLFLGKKAYADRIKARHEG
ncbi:MAG: MFS transporter [Henriciella sp.]